MTAQPPPVKDAFDFFYPPLMYTGEHTWASVYPFGHPAALALGSIFGLMWLVPAVMGAGTAIFLYLVGRRLYGNATGVVAIVLLASSPFFLMTASNFMSHNTAAFYLTAALFFVVNRDRPRLYGALAGLFYGLLINTRTLTAVGLMIPLGIVFLGRLLPPRTRITAAKHFAAFAVFACVMAGAYLWYNYAITGDPLKSPYEAVGNLSEWFGFSGRHTLASGLQNEQVQMATLLVVFNGWPR